MYFVKKRNKNSKQITLQLIQSKRVNGKPKQKIVVSLGSNFELPDEIKKDVAQAVTDKLKGQKTFFKSQKVEDIAEKIIRRIQENTNNPYLVKRNETEETEEVYVDQIEHNNDRIAGPLVIGNSIWDDINFSEILDKCGFSKKQAKLAQITILNRLISQDCEYAIPSWIKTYAVSSLIYKKAETIGKDPFYRISDKLLKQKEQIEKKLYNNIKSLFDLENTIILYDLTNTYFEGQGIHNPKAQFNGNQKEKRTDCPQIVIALMIDEDGFVIKHKIFNGKMSDAKSLKLILDSIHEEYKDRNNKPTLIFDRGVTSEANIEIIKSEKYKFNYILAARNSEENRNLKEFQEEEFLPIKQDKNNEVKVYLKEENGENYLLCKSSGRKRKEESMYSKKEKKMIEEFEKLKKKIFSYKKLTNKDIFTKIGRIQEKFSTISRYYQVNYKHWSFNYKISNEKTISKRVLDILKSRKNKCINQKISFNNLKKDLDKFKKKYGKEFAGIEINLTEPIFTYDIIEEKEKHRKTLEGNYLLRTNRHDLDEEKFWKIYTLLTKVEHAFRHIKTDLGLQPNYHHKEKRVDGHVFISILAYQILNTIEFKLRQKKCKHSWATINRIMTSHTYSSIIMPLKNGKTMNIRKPGIPERQQVKIYEMLDIDYEKLTKSKMIL